MPDSKSAIVDNTAHGLVMAAMAWRVKYRKKDADGNAIKIKAMIAQCGVHKKNRGSVYASGLRVQSLAQDTVRVGFIKEEFNSTGVAVEEPPADYITKVCQKGLDYESGLAYNLAQSSKDPKLCTLFLEPHNCVNYTLLGHNTMMLVLRAFLAGAKWDWSESTEKKHLLCR